MRGPGSLAEKEATDTQANHFYKNFGIYSGGLFFIISNMTQPFITLYAQEAGISTGMIGLIVTMRSFLPIFIAMPIGQLIDSIGPARMLKYGMFFLILSLVTNVASANVWMLSLSQVWIGVSFIIMTTSFQVMVSEGTKKERNENIKNFSMWTSAGGLLGPLIGGALISMFTDKMAGYRFIFGFASVLAVLFLAVIFIVFKNRTYEPKEGAAPPGELFNVKGIVRSYGDGLHLAKLRSVQFGLAATFLIMYIQWLYMSFLPIYLNEIGYSTMIISVIISMKEFSAMVSRYALGWIMRRAPMERILIIAGFVAAVCVTLTPLAGLNAAGIICAVLILGGAVGINMPVSIMIMLNDSEEADRGKVMGLRLIVNRFAQILSPAMFGVLGQYIGLTIAFYSGGAFLVSTMVGFTVYSSLRWKTAGATKKRAEQ